MWPPLLEANKHLKNKITRGSFNFPPPPLPPAFFFIRKTSVRTKLPTIMIFLIVQQWGSLRSPIFFFFLCLWMQLGKGTSLLPYPHLGFLQLPTKGALTPLFMCGYFQKRWVWHLSSPPLQSFSSCKNKGAQEENLSLFHYPNSLGF